MAVSMRKALMMLITTSVWTGSYTLSVQMLKGNNNVHYQAWKADEDLNLDDEYFSPFANVVKEAKEKTNLSRQDNCIAKVDTSWKPGKT